MAKYLMALDQGTTGSRCILFDTAGNPVCSAAQEYTQYFPRDGWVEHDPMQIFDSQLAAAKEAMRKAEATAADIYAIGITNQRETITVWDKTDGKPIYRSIVWQCRRTADDCEKLKADGIEPTIKERTGLVCDPYFSASKLRWILQNAEGATEKAESGRLLCGTVDTWLMWKLSGGKIFATDASNASRTMLCNIRSGDWDDDLLRLFGVPRAMLPEIKPSAGLFGYTDPSLFGGAIPITGVAGDQQAAMFGQGCHTPGDVKNTYGTGGFLLMNIGELCVTPKSGLLTTVAWKLGDRVTYACEGSVFVCGAAVQWLRDGLGLIRTAAETETIARSVESSGGVYVVPAFCGLGAPYWDPYARGMICGITRGTTRAHLVRATLESMAYQTNDLLHAIETECGVKLSRLRADGGAAANDFLLSFQSDLSALPVIRPKCIETTALGAALLAGLGAGLFKDVAETQQSIAPDRIFEPTLAERERQALLDGWKTAVSRVTRSALS